jgi:hypothetical protein
MKAREGLCHLRYRESKAQSLMLKDALGKIDGLKREKNFLDAIAVIAADSMDMEKDVVPILKLSRSFGIRRVWLTAETVD